jgi:hypothetical protein
MTARTARDKKMIDAISVENKPTANSAAANQGDKMNAAKLKEEHRATYDEILALGRELGAKAERERVCAHLVLAEGSGDYDTAHEAIQGGEEMTQLVMARHQSAAMKRDMKVARRADNPDDIEVSGEARNEQEAEAAKALADFQAANPGCTIEVDTPAREVN